MRLITSKVRQQQLRQLLIQDTLSLVGQEMRPELTTLLIS